LHQNGTNTDYQKVFENLCISPPCYYLNSTGSSYNILQSRLALHLTLCTILITPFFVMDGNGESIQCSSLCPNVSVSIQTHACTISFYLLPIEGADVVIGMDWLRSLRPLQIDFSTPQLSFSHNGSQIALHGSTKLLYSQASFTHLCHYLHTDVITSLHLLTVNQVSTPKLTTNPPHNSGISTLLHT